MAYFKCGSGSGNVVKIDGVEVDGDLKLKKKTANVTLPNLPFVLSQGTAVNFNGVIHVLGGNNTDGRKNHYKLVNNEWVSVSTPPCDIYCNSAVVYKDAIHVVYGTTHYKFNGSTWTTVNSSVSSYSYLLWILEVLNDKIYAFAWYSSSTKFAKCYDGSSWANSTATPNKQDSIAITNYDNAIHCLGGSGTLTYHYKFNGSTWTSVSTLPFSLFMGNAKVLNNELHVLGGRISNMSGFGYEEDYRYVYRDNVWVQLNDLPIMFSGGASITVDDGVLIAGSYASLYEKASSSASLIYPYGKCAFIIDKTTYEIAS